MSHTAATHPTPDPTAPPTAHTIVVGYDGSAAATAAVRWAAEHLAGPHGRLVVVHGRRPGTPPVAASRIAARARAGLESLWMNDTVLAGVEIELRHADEPPARALSRIAADEEAEWIVVGRHAGPALSSHTVGELLRCTDLPVTVAP
jgi:nucleotide-binding universal stress UspA family protein